MPWSLLSQELREGLPGVFGSLVAIPFMRGSPLQRVGKGLGGAVLSYYAAAPLAVHVLHRPELQGLAGFLLGLLGMAVVQVVYDALHALSGTAIGQAATEWALRRLRE